MPFEMVLGGWMPTLGLLLIPQYAFALILYAIHLRFKELSVHREVAHLAIVLVGTKASLLLLQLATNLNEDTVGGFAAIAVAFAVVSAIIFFKSLLRLLESFGG